MRAERRKAKNEGKEKYQGYSKEDILVRGRGCGSSKIDSFERWNEKKDNGGGEKQKSAADGGIGRREVTAFDFDTDVRSHANGSPELGIREVLNLK